MVKMILEKKKMAVYFVDSMMFCDPIPIQLSYSIRKQAAPEAQRAWAKLGPQKVEMTQEFYSFVRGDPGDIRDLGQEREGTLWNLEAGWPIPGVRGAGLWLPCQGRWKSFGDGSISLALSRGCPRVY